MSLSIDCQRLHIGERLLIRDLRIHCVPGQVVTLMGQSGSGKSSLLAAIAGLPIQGLRFEGAVTLQERDISTLPTSQRQIGLLFQDDLLFAHMSVRENLLFAVPAGPASQRASMADEALAELGFEAMAHRSPLTLSGGQRARVSLMRTLLAKPAALLLDEPFSKLDAGLRAQFRAFLFSHVQRLGLPTLLVTHDEQDVANPEDVVKLPPLGPSFEPLS